MAVPPEGRGDDGRSGNVIRAPYLRAQCDKRRLSAERRGTIGLLSQPGNSGADTNRTGAAYLLWMGALMLWNSQRRRRAAAEPHAAEEEQQQRTALGTGLLSGRRRGVTTNPLNPEMGVFYAAVLPPSCRRSFRRALRTCPWAWR
jgi:hypothetical protein